MKFLPKIDYKTRRLRKLEQQQEQLQQQLQLTNALSKDAAKAAAALLSAAESTTSPNQYFKEKLIKNIYLESSSYVETALPKILSKCTNEDLLYKGSFHEAVGKVILMSQFFALMPIKGVTAASPKQLSYSWKNLRNWYSLAYVLLTFIDLGFVLYKVLHGSITFNTIEPIIFHISIIIVTINTISLAKKWPELMCYWSDVENNLPEYKSQYEKRRMAQKIKMVTFVGMTLSLGEHLLSTISVIHYSNFCPLTKDKDPIKNFFLYFNDHIFFIFSYSHWLAFLGKFVNVLLTFSWNYMDVFVMVISIGLASKFKQINDNLLNFKGMVAGTIVTYELVLIQFHEDTTLLSCVKNRTHT